jgi:uncharacterized protein (DUF488 family)
MIRQASNSKAKTLYTADDEGESVDVFFQKLVEAGIKRLLDARDNAISRKRGFSKGKLRELCEANDIDYVHLRQLGIPSSYRKAFKTFDDYEKLLYKYERYILPKVPDVQQEASRLALERPTAFLCFEADANYCHRGRLAEAISSGTGMNVVHLR